MEHKQGGSSGVTTGQNGLPNTKCLQRKRTNVIIDI